MSKTIQILGSVIAAALVTSGCRRAAEPPAPRVAYVETVNTPVRVTMAELHQAGGVPPNWSFTLPVGDPVAGREVFELYGCSSCHTVGGEQASPRPSEHAGPDLGGMGSHHPQVYFVESILNPDAVLVEGPGYIGDDGRSNMPAYPDLTAEQLTDLVAYLKSLVDPEADPHSGCGESFSGRVDLAASSIPAPASGAPAAAPTAKAKATMFFVQTFSLRDKQLPNLQRWFESEGKQTFRSFDGLLELETYVDRTRGPESLVTVFAFADLATLQAFIADRRIAQALEKFDEFSEVIDRQMYESRPVYPVGTLSLG